MGRVNAESIWNRMRSAFGYGPDPQGKLAGTLAPQGRQDPAIEKLDQTDIFSPSLPFGTQPNASYVGTDSSNVHSYAYVPHLVTSDYQSYREGDRGDLYITFRAKTNSRVPGRTYLYPNFSEDDYFAFSYSGSKGRWVWENIRRRLYPDGSGTYFIVDRSAPVVQQIEYEPPTPSPYWQDVRRRMVDPLPPGTNADGLSWLFPDN